MPNLAESSVHYSNATNRDVQEQEKQGQMIEAIRNEHNRIYMQDQRLLANIKESMKNGKNTFFEAYANTA